MTTTRGSITNSKLFTSLPLSKEPKEPNSQKNTKKYILKGHNDSSYEHKGGDDDIFAGSDRIHGFRLVEIELLDPLGLQASSQRFRQGGFYLSVPGLARGDLFLIHQLIAVTAMGGHSGQKALGIHLLPPRSRRA